MVFSRFSRTSSYNPLYSTILFPFALSISQASTSRDFFIHTLLNMLIVQSYFAISSKLHYRITYKFSSLSFSFSVASLPPSFNPRFYNAKSHRVTRSYDCAQTTFSDFLCFLISHFHRPQ